MHYFTILINLLI